MREIELEERLRRVLREEADSVPFAVTADEARRRLALRRSRRSGPRVTWLAAAAALIVTGGVGIALVGGLLNDRAEPTPAPSTSPGPSATAADVVPTPSAPAVSLPDLTPAGGTVIFDVTWPAGQPGGTITVPIGTAPASPRYWITYACLGPGAFHYELGAAGGPTFYNANAGDPCDGEPRSVDSRIVSATGFAVTVEADPGATWRFILSLESKAPVTPSQAHDADIGAESEAIVVSYAGEPIRPSSIDVSRLVLDAAAFETRLAPQRFASIPGRVIPEAWVLDEFRLDPRASSKGWLALALGPASGDVSAPAILIVDLRDAEAEPWIVAGELGAGAWGPSGLLAIADPGAIRVLDPATRTERRVPRSAGGFDAPGTPAWRADGLGVLDRIATGETTMLVSLMLDGSVVEHGAGPPAAIHQATGLERPTSIAGTSVGVGCDQSGDPANPGRCVLVSTEPGSLSVWIQADSTEVGFLQDWAWTSRGEHLWVLLDGGGAGVAGASQVVLGTVDAPGAPVGEVARMPVTWASSGSQPRLLGLRDGSQFLDGQHVLVGSDTDREIRFVIAGDGSRATLDGGYRFAGWASPRDAYGGE